MRDSFYKRIMTIPCPGGNHDKVVPEAIIPPNICYKCGRFNGPSFLMELTPVCVCMPEPPNKPKNLTKEK